LLRSVSAAAILADILCAARSVQAALRRKEEKTEKKMEVLPNSSAYIVSRRKV
jgi:hypothetical protein